MLKKQQTTTIAAYAVLALAGSGVFFMPDTLPTAQADRNRRAGDGRYAGSFMISSSGSVAPDMDYVARFRVLGAAISAGGQYDVPVTLELTVNGERLEPFGDFDSPTDGNVNDGSNYPTGYKDFILDDAVSAGSTFSIQARSWLRDSDEDDDGWRDDEDWRDYLSVGTTSNSPNMLVLRNGDPVPDITPFLDQHEIEFFVKNFVHPRKNEIRIWNDEVIVLFELGTTDLDSDAADFQDLVVIVTLAEDPAALERPRFHPNLLFD